MLRLVNVISGVPSLYLRQSHACVLVEGGKTIDKKLKQRLRGPYVLSGSLVW